MLNCKQKDDTIGQCSICAGAIGVRWDVLGDVISTKMVIWNH